MATAVGAVLLVLQMVTVAGLVLLMVLQVVKTAGSVLLVPQGLVLLLLTFGRKIFSTAEYIIDR